jgi:hypothetical protein
MSCHLALVSKYGYKVNNTGLVSNDAATQTQT